MKYDYSDLGNVILGGGAAVGAYLASKGYVAESLLLIALSGVAKAFCSALDNYKYKKAESIKGVNL